MEKKDAFRLLAFDARYITPYGIGYAADSIAVAMNNTKLECCIISYFNELGYDKEFRKPLFRRNLVYKLSQKLLKKRQIDWLITAKLTSQIVDFDGVHFWTNCNIAQYQSVKNHNKLILHEAINTHQRYARTILADEYQRLGLEYTGITDADIADENNKLALADYIFSPSPNVTASMLENNIILDKIIESSYGLGPHQLNSPDNVRLKNKPLNALFVGSGIIRKGIHLLLEYWNDANLNGKLVIVGNIDPAIEYLVKPYRSNTNFEFVDFTTDINLYFQQADVFVLPSLEEGSQLVTYLAVGAGLPCIVSPMGGGGIIRDGIEGFIIDPHDKELWINILEKIAKNEELLKSLSNAAYKRAEHYLWQNVGLRRAQALFKKIGINS